MCTIWELTNSIAELCNWIRELSNSSRELTNTANILQYWKLLELGSYPNQLQISIGEL